jgi:hypothetical protein
MFCSKCGAALYESDVFCAACGIVVSPRVGTGYGQRAIAAPPQSVPPIGSHGFGQTFGLDPRVAFVTLIVDVMLNAGDIASMGLLAPVSIGAGIAVGYVTYKMQMHWYGDDKESAKIKGIVLGLLTAIPTPLPALLYVPSGLIGLFHKFRRKPKLSHA